MNVKIRPFLALIFLLIVAMHACALAIQTDKNSYEKGETILVTADREADIEIFKGMIKIAEGTAIVDVNGFVFSYSPLFSDPSGTWTIKANKRNESAEQYIEMNIPPVGAYYLITFFSPSEGEHRRAKNLEVTVEITDSGNAVLGATAFLYDSLGVKIKLQQIGPGRYITDYKIPFNAEIGAFKLTVAAAGASGERGGENSITLNIIESHILIEIIKPTTQSIALGQETKFVIKPTYFDGAPADQSTIVSGTINGQAIEFLQQANDEYAATYVATKTGELSVQIETVDAAGQKGSKTFTVIASGELEFIIMQYWHIIGLVLIVTLFVIYKLQATAIYNYRLRSLEKKRGACRLRLKGLQDRYYNKKTLNRESYDVASAECKREAIKFDEKIKALNKKAKYKKG